MGNHVQVIVAAATNSAAPAGTKNGRADPLPFAMQICPSYFLFTAFFSSAPGENFATLRAEILIVAPVCGLRPFRAFLCDIEKVPKPINATRSPLRNAPVMLLTAVSIAVVACALLISLAPAILSTRSALFIVVSPRRFLSYAYPAPIPGGQKFVSGLGNLTGRILLSPARMSTVKIRARSLFRTPTSRIGAAGAGFGWRRKRFPRFSTALAQASQVVHRALVIGTCGERPFGCKVRRYSFFQREVSEV